jgi:hypothetical protein
MNSIFIVERAKTYRFIATYDPLPPFGSEGGVLGDSCRGFIPTHLEFSPDF